MKERIKVFRELIKEKKMLTAMETLIEWDIETTASPKNAELLSKMIGDISMRNYNLSTSDELNALLSFFMNNRTKINKTLKKEVEILTEEAERIETIPPKEYQEYSELIAKSHSVWQEAKVKKDFGIFKKNLKKIFEFTKKFAKYEQNLEKNKNKSVYDILLNHYEKGMTTEKLDIFFDGMKKEIVPLLKEVLKKQKKSDIKIEKVDINTQRDFSKYLSQYLGFDFIRGAIGESAHPFTTSINKNDVRFTTKYTESDPLSAFFSTVHETGHGIYEQQVGDNLVETILETGGSMGLHESQSRFYENIIGRNKSFWKGLKKTKKLYPQLQKINIDTLYSIINKVEKSPIRIEADELTYSLHIMVRYEIEKEICEDKIAIEDLPKIWDEKMREYLGITPKNVSQGVLQDVHWSCGLIGYFPSYALGSAYASQIYHAMKKDLNVEEILEKGELPLIQQWLENKIHKFGLSKDTNEIIKKVTGQELNPTYYIDYLKNKYLELNK